MLGGPPQDAALGRGLCQEGQAELKDAGGAEGAMREVAMVARADREDPHQIQRDASTIARHVSPVQKTAKHPTWISTKPMLEG